MESKEIAFLEKLLESNMFTTEVDGYIEAAIKALRYKQRRESEDMAEAESALHKQEESK